MVCYVLHCSRQTDSDNVGLHMHQLTAAAIITITILTTWLYFYRATHTLRACIALYMQLSGVCLSARLSHAANESKHLKGFRHEVYPHHIMYNIFSGFVNVDIQGHFYLEPCSKLIPNLTNFLVSFLPSQLLSIKVRSILPVFTSRVDTVREHGQCVPSLSSAVASLSECTSVRPCLQYVGVTRLL